MDKYELPEPEPYNEHGVGLFVAGLLALSGLILAVIFFVLVIYGTLQEGGVIGLVISFVVFGAIAKYNYGERQSVDVQGVDRTAGMPNDL